MSLAVLAALPKLPVETLSWLASSEAAEFTGAVPGIDPAFDPVPFVSVVATMVLSISGVNVAHELSHRCGVLLLLARMLLLRAPLRALTLSAPPAWWQRCAT